MDIAHLRPWEYDAFPWWQYERISAMKDAWAEAKLRYPPPTRGEQSNPKPKPHAIRTDGTGPQF